jgi:hypothetical protein
LPLALALALAQVKHTALHGCKQQLLHLTEAR